MAGAQAVGGADGYDQQWMDHWRTGVQPGQLWDAGRCSPQLDALLGTSTTSSSSSQQLQVQGKRVLVPGCGRGYDVCAFAAAGASLAVGLDLSEEAVAAARAECAARLQERALGACELVSGDFFAYTHPSGAAFDVGWDYTFLCAIEPSMRQDWAAAWARLLAPGGLLVTLMFPVGGVPASAPRRDPPWAVTPELYRELLLPAGFSEVHVGEVPHALSHAPRAGREWLGLWRRCAQAGWAGGGSSTRSTSAEGGASDGGAGGPARL